MKKKFLSIILLAAMLISVIPISPIYVSADTVTIGRDIDSWAQGYIDEVNNQQTYNCVVSLSEESGCVKSGKSLKFTFKSDGNARFVNDYWLPSTSADGYMGMKFWVYNPGENEVHMGLRLANDQNYSLKRSAAYILEYEDGNTVSKSTVFDHSAKDTNLNQYGEMQIPAGFKGTVYIPFDSLYTKPASVGKYRLDFYTDDGTIYFDEFKLYNEDVNVNIINDFEEDIKIDYSDNSEISLSNEEAFSGKSLKLTVPNARVSTSIIYGNSAVSFDKFSNIRMYIVNNHADAYLSFRFEGMSLRTGDKYYTVDINSGAKKEYICGKNIFSTATDWGAYLADVVIPSGFKGWLYLPLSAIANTNGSQDSTIGAKIRFDILFSSGVGSLYIDHIVPGNENLCSDKTLLDFNNYTDGYMDEINNTNSYGMKLSLDSSNSYSGKSICFALGDIPDGQTAYAWFVNNAWVPNTSCSEQYDGIALWFKNPSQYSVKVSWRDYYNTDFSLKNGAEYYSIDKDGKRTRNTATNTMFGEQRLAEMIIPANFEGYLYMPLTSLYRQSDSIGKFRIDFKAEEKVNIYMDNYTLFAKKSFSIPTVFSDGALFQQNKPIKLWGYDLPGTAITAELYKNGSCIETANGNTDGDGKWNIAFSAQKGGYEKYSITVKNSDETVACINDVLIGELWLSSGQSNMELIISQAQSPDEIINKANDNTLRFFLEPTAPTASQGNKQPSSICKDIPGAYWINGTDSEVLRANMSAVACVFAYNLKEKLNVPVGVINTAVGGTVIEAWLSREAVENDAEVLKAFKDYGQYYSEDEVRTTYAWTTLFNQKIGPLGGLNIAGTIWYQGESNNGRAAIYGKQLDLLKRSWSTLFGFENNSMPFIFSQVAPDCYDGGVNNPYQLGVLAETMTDAYKKNENNNISMLTIYDIPLDYGVTGTIHPIIKIPVGERFAEAAMSVCYGGVNDYTAPVIESYEIKGDTIYAKFSHVGSGLSSGNGNIHGFTIAGADGVYVNANAIVISSDTVMVWNDYLKNPKNITYAFANMNQSADLKNSFGIPAAPFRTDRTSGTYITLEEWMNADADAWEAVSGNKSGYKPSWVVNAKNGFVSYAYSETVKTEGKASLEISYSETDSFTLSPVINAYNGKRFNAANYKSLKLDIKNESPNEAKIELIITGADGNSYSASLYGTDKTSKSVDGNGFNEVVFDLTNLYNGSEKVTDVESVLNNCSIAFNISDLSGEKVYIDNISVGRTSKSAVFGDINDDGDINSKDLALLRKSLLGVKCDANTVKSDVNRNGTVDITDLVRLKKFLS